ncbi:MAG: crotonase/enoyl-CoA hydratase family protein [Sphingomonadaceae bacterium]|nr:crotonase/enoyl-CoA hydratase family protein [Sphingomonadaceae bacterium]
MRFGDGETGVAVSIDDGVADVRLDRPAKHNALNPTLMNALEEVLDYLSSHEALRCVVLSGEGRSFCSGFDITVLGSGGIEPLGPRTHGITNHAQHCSWGWRELPVPVITALHGHCYGAGLQIAMGADIRIAAPDARLSVMEMRHGLVPDMGLFALARGLVRDDQLRELVYTAREFSGEEAARLGFVTRTDEAPRDAAKALARQIAQASPAAVAAAKRLLGRLYDDTAAGLHQSESDEQDTILATISRAPQG